MKILIYGTGYMAERLLQGQMNVDILGFIETIQEKVEFHGLPVYSIKNIPGNWDYIIVTPECADEIYRIILENNVDVNKCIFWNRCLHVKYNSDPKVRSMLGEQNHSIYAHNYGQWIGTFFEDDIELYTTLNKRKDFEIKEKYLYPIIGDKYGKNSGMDEYFWQDLWAAKNIIKDGVKIHYDIGSRVDGFIAHLLVANIKVNMIDIRPFNGECENLYTVVDDATMLKQFKDNSIESLSAMCSIEHFGLGRYGDPIDPEACFKTFSQVQKKLKSGGKFYFSVPIGNNRVEFNAHRVFKASTLIQYLSDLQLVEYSAIVGNRIKSNVSIDEFDCLDEKTYVVGLFCFTKN